MKTGQNFATAVGDSASLPFIVTDQNNNPLNIATIADAIWTARRDMQTAIAITKKMSLGQITFTTNGSDGGLQVALPATDTSGLAGYYIHQLQIIDGSGNPTTVATGRMQATPYPIWTYTGDPTTTDKDAVRYLTGDTIYTDQLAMDSEILYALAQATTQYGASAVVCRSIAGRLAREADTVDKDLRNTLGARSAAFLRMASEFEVKNNFGAFWQTALTGRRIKG
jgi:hypothetical protein